MKISHSRSLVRIGVKMYRMKNQMMKRNKVMAGAIALMFMCITMNAQEDITWEKISAGTEYSIAIASDGTLWGWGNNGNGQLGINNTLTQTIPAQAGSDTDWADISAGAFHALGLKTDGTLWSWGLSSVGQLGIPGNVQLETPTQIGTDTWTVIDAGQGHNLAIKSDGSLWSWGFNFNGQLGIGGTDNTDSPVQIGTDTDWADVSAGGGHSLAIKNDGSLWSWGANTGGQLGTGTQDQVDTPMRIDSSVWISIATGFEFSAAIKQDSTLWTWGFNGNGQVGHVGMTTVLEPTIVEEGMVWNKVACGSSFLLAIDDDNSLWGSGFNGVGQLGVDDATQLDSLTLIDKTDIWVDLALAEGAATQNGIFGLHSLALKEDRNAICATGANYISQLGNDDTQQLSGFECMTGLFVSVEDELVASKEVNIYPNPSNGIVYLDFAPQGIRNAQINVYDFTGRQVYRGENTEDFVTLDLSNYQSGIYTIVVAANGTRISERVLIQH